MDVTSGRSWPIGREVSHRIPGAQALHTHMGRHNYSPVFSCDGPVALAVSGASTDIEVTVGVFVVAATAGCLSVVLAGDACFFDGSQPGARVTIIDISLPSISGVRSM